MPNSKQIVYLSQSQYAELIANGTITVDGVTVTYDENDIYVTPQAEPVTDVRVNGTSVTVNGVSNIPVAAQNTFGVIKVNGNFGVGLVTAGGNSGTLVLSGSASSTIKAGVNEYSAIIPARQHESVFYGLSKLAGVNLASEAVTVGTYPDSSKAAIQSMLGVSDLIATAENSLVASKAYAIGDVFTANGKLYKATAAIAADAAIIPAIEGEEIAGANCEETSVGEGFVKFTDYATGDTAGVIKINANNGIDVATTGAAYVKAATETQIKQGTHAYKPIIPATQHQSVFYGLAKVAGADEKDSTLPVGQYTDTAKSAIRSMIGAENGDDIVKVQDTEPTTAATKIWLPETPPASVEVPTVTEMNAALANKANLNDIPNVPVEDVQVNGTSVVTDGVAAIPVIQAHGQIGAVRTNLRGLTYHNDPYDNTLPKVLGIDGASVTDCKQRTSYWKVATPACETAYVFYGLAGAAGDDTQRTSTNAVGAYTDNAKASIKSMLGIVDGSTGTIDISGTTPTITAVENTRYVCGEVTSLSFTPAASGICIVRFTSGSTVTVLTLPSTVKFPEWFDPTSLETNTIYEICITDGVYGAVMSWAL